MTARLERKNDKPGERQFRLTNPFQVGLNPTQKETIQREKHTYLDNRGTSEHFSLKTPKKSASQKLELRRKSKEKLVRLLKKAGEKDLANKVALCHSKFAVLTCGKHIAQKIPNYSCEHRLCVDCARKRSRRIIEKYEPLLFGFLKTGKFTPVHLVLTVAHRSGEMMKDGRNRLMTAFKKLQKRRFWKTHFAGGLYGCEITIADDGANHVHLHILAFRRRFFDISMLRSEWKEITGDSHVLRLDRITDLTTGLREVVKYLSKPSDIGKYTVNHIRQFLNLRHARLFGAFGDFSRFCRNEKCESDNDGGEKFGFCEGDCCPKCGEVLFEIPMTIDELILYQKKVRYQSQTKQLRE